MSSMSQVEILDVYSEMCPWPVAGVMRGGCGLRSRLFNPELCHMTGHLPFWLRLEAALCKKLYILLVYDEELMEAG